MEVIVREKVTPLSGKLRFPSSLSFEDTWRSPPSPAFMSPMTRTWLSDLPIKSMDDAVVGATNDGRRSRRSTKSCHLLAQLRYQRPESVVTSSAVCDFCTKKSSPPKSGSLP